MFERGCSWDEVKKATGLPSDVLDVIAAPILAEREVRKAERRILRERQDAERKRLREIQPCPLCSTGYARPEHYTLSIPNVEVEGVGRGITADVHFCRCSNVRCIARLVFPRESDEEAIEAFVQGRFVERHPYTDVKTGVRVYPNNVVLAYQVKWLIGEFSADEVKRLGFNPEAVDRIAMEVEWDRMVFDPDAFDTTLMCPKCGMRGEYRKAVNPVTHRRGWDCWWRVGCPHCKARTRYSFPTREEAAAAFESGHLDREPEDRNGGE